MERGGRRDHEQRPEQIDVSRRGALDGGQRMPRIGEHPPRAAAARRQPAPQQQHGQQVAHDDGRDDCRHRFVDARDDPQEELRGGRIDGRQDRAGRIDAARIRRVQRRQRRVGRRRGVRVVAVLLHPPVPEVAIDVVGGDRRGADQHQAAGQGDQQARRELPPATVRAADQQQQRGNVGNRGAPEQPQERQRREPCIQARNAGQQQQLRHTAGQDQPRRGPADQRLGAHHRDPPGVP